MREIIRDVYSAVVSLPNDEHFIAELLKNEYDSLDSGGDLRVLMALQGAIAERKVREALPVLNQMITDSRTQAIHEDLAETLGQMGDKNSVPYLIRALSSEQVGVRAKSALSLAQLADPQTIPPLILLLRDESDTVRENAIRALTELGAVEASQRLMDLAASPEESSYIRSQAIRALGRMRVQKALPLVRKVLDQEEDEDVIKAATHALALMEAPHSQDDAESK